MIKPSVFMEQDVILTNFHCARERHKTNFWFAKVSVESGTIGHITALMSGTTTFLQFTGFLDAIIPNQEKNGKRTGAC